jgi:hypothetical protein
MFASGERGGMGNISWLPKELARRSLRAKLAVRRWKDRQRSQRKADYRHHTAYPLAIDMSEVIALPKKQRIAEDVSLLFTKSRSVATHAGSFTRHTVLSMTDSI